MFRWQTLKPISETALELEGDSSSSCLPRPI